MAWQRLHSCMEAQTNQVSGLVLLWLLHGLSSVGMPHWQDEAGYASDLTF
jgi:hypothetical protein